MVMYYLIHCYLLFFFFFSSRRRHTRFDCDWSSDVCSSDLTCTRRTPRFIASRAACSAATVAANGVDFLEPWNPALPEEPHVMALPCISVIVMSVLLKVAVMWAMPSASTTFLARLALAAAGFACAIYFFSRGFFLPAIARPGPFSLPALSGGHCPRTA